MGVYYLMRLGSVWGRGGLKNSSSGDSCPVYEGSGGRSVFVVYAHEILHTETAKGVRLRVLPGEDGECKGERGREGLKNKSSDDSF